MANQKEVLIKLTDEQRNQIKSATGQDLTELKVGMVESTNPLAANPLEDRANPFGALEDRANPFGALEDRANPFGALEDRANPFGALEDRANPFGPLEDRANPLKIVE